MTDTIKLLAQAIPAAATLTPIYTVAASTSAMVSTVMVCNQAGTSTTFRISVAIAGAADTPAQYLYYDLPIGANDSYGATQGWSLAATDVIRGQSANGLCSFNVFGVEVT